MWKVREEEEEGSKGGKIVLLTDLTLFLRNLGILTFFFI